MISQVTEKIQGIHDCMPKKPNVDKWSKGCITKANSAMICRESSSVFVVSEYEFVHDPDLACMDLIVRPDLKRQIKAAFLSSVLLIDLTIGLRTRFFFLMRYITRQVHLRICDIYNLTTNLKA